MDSSDCGAYCCVEGVYLSIESHFFFLNLECNRGAKSPTEKCPVQIADLVLLHNVIVEAIN